MPRPHYDHLETREPEVREAALMESLSRQIAHAKANAPYFARLLEGVDPAEITSREALARLPVTRKAELHELQGAAPPFGGLVTGGWGELARVYVSPGPIHDPEGRGKDWWRSARALFAAGFRRGELVHNAFSYHFTPAGMIFETGCHALGCTVFPAGVGQTEAQARAIAGLRPSGYTGTPSFLKTILDKARELDLDTSSLTKALVTGEALPPDLRWLLEEEHGVQTYQCYGTADLGIVAYESEAREGLIVDEGAIVEIVRPGTGDPVPEGEVGEVVVTILNPDYPLIRFATGDMSAVMSGASPCGRTNMRIKGWMGRADQTTKVKGMFVHPHQVAEVARRHAEVRKARLVVEREGPATDVMTLHCEVAAPAAEGLAEAIAESIQSVCKLKGQVRLVAPGSLPNDGKVIEDARPPATSA